MEQILGSSWNEDTEIVLCPESVKSSFQVIEGRGSFGGPIFRMLTMRTSIVYKFCSTRHLHNIRSIYIYQIFMR